MVSGLIQTKINTPRIRKRLVQRPGLLQKLDAGLRGKLILVSAPAGYGKTTVVATWLRQLENSVTSLGNSPSPQYCWFSLDTDDNDPVLFATYLASALGSVDQTLGGELMGILQASQGLAMQVFITAMIDAIIRFDRELIIVFDDYHRIVNKPIHDALIFLLEHQPPQLHLLLMTREDPPFPLSRIRARRELTEIRFEDLRFTKEDSAVFLVDVMDLPLSEHEIAALGNRTEGWITGLQLAALSIRGRPDVSGFVESFTGSHRYILDFLVDEVFLQQSVEMQEFLLETAVLDRLTASLCNAVTERGDSQKFLLEAEQANLFFIALDDSREWFRFHQLFADLLRERLRRSDYPHSALHSRASEWYEKQNYIDEAIKHALAANDLQRAALLMENVSEMFLRRGQISTLLGWKQALSSEVTYERVKLCMDFAWALVLAREVDEAEHLLEPIVEIAANSSDLLSQVLMLQAHIARTRHDIQRTITLSEQALELIPAEDFNAYGIVGINLGVAYMYKGDLAQAEEVFMESAQRLQKAENHHGSVMALGFVGQVQAIFGKLYDAAATQRRAIHLGMDNRAQPATGRAHVNLAALLYEWNDLEAAAHHLHQARKLSKRTGDNAVEWDASRLLAKVRQAQGDDFKAVGAIESANVAARKGDAPPNVHLANALAYLHIALQQNDLALAETIAVDICELAPNLASVRYDLLVNAGSLLAIPGIGMARLLKKQGNLLDAEDLLDACYEEAISVDYPCDQISARLGQVCIISDEEGSLEFLAEAVNLAKQEGYVRTFVDTGQVLLPLLKNRKVSEIAPDHVMMLSRSFPFEEDNLQADIGWQNLIEPLSEREWEILQLLAERQTNAEIAQAITISVNTVKTHLQHIYEKLGVHDRRTAVARAEELNLLR